MTPQQLISHLIYGDIEHASLAILGDDCPSCEEYNAMDVEQQTRLAAAATVAAWFNSTEHKTMDAPQQAFAAAAKPDATPDQIEAANAALFARASEQPDNTEPLQP